MGKENVNSDFDPIEAAVIHQIANQYNLGKNSNRRRHKVISYIAGMTLRNKGKAKNEKTNLLRP